MRARLDCVTGCLLFVREKAICVSDRRLANALTHAVKANIWSLSLGRCINDVFVLVKVMHAKRLNTVPHHGAVQLEIDTWRT